MTFSFFFRLLPALLWAMASTCYAQESLDPRQELAAQMDTLDRDFAGLQGLVMKVQAVAGVEREILMHRVDLRAIRLLRRADELAVKLTGLPADDPMVVQLRGRVMTEFEQVGDKVFDRIGQIDVEIFDELDSLQDASGTQRIARAARVDLLDDQRLQYLRAMSRHVGVREQLGLSNDKLLPRVQQHLLMRAETLAGSLSLTSKMIRDLRTRRGGEGSRADIDAMLAYAMDRRSHYLDGLRAVTVMMDGLGMNTRDYQSLLVAEEGVSFRLFDLDVMGQLFEEWGDAVRTFLVTWGPDLVFKLFLVVAILFISRVLARMTRNLVQSVLERSGADASVLLKNTLVSLAGGTVIVLGILIALSQVGLSIGPMLAGLGIAGFIIGFALQDTLANFASGAMILIYRPYDVDDYVEVTGATGVVKKMNLVSTTINTFDNQTLVVPNSKIWGDVIKNVTQQKLRRVDLEFGIGYGDDIPRAERILAEVAADHELVLDSPETNVRVHRLGESSVDLIVRPWVKTEDYWQVYWDLTREVKLRFDREGITIPFPQRDVHVHRGDGETPPA